MEKILPVLRKEIIMFNRHCLLASGGSFFLALLAWGLFFGLYGALALLIQTLRLGPDAPQPQWFFPLFIGLAALLFLWASIRNARRKFSPPPDRPVLGVHLFGDIVLLPALLTFAVFDNLDARIQLCEKEKRLAAELVELIFEEGSVFFSALGQYYPDGKFRRRALVALQILGYIDKIHKGDDWLYSIVSTREAALQDLMGTDKQQDEDN